MAPEGDLDKPAAGIPVGHKLAGVYFHSDYLDGSGMGEIIAIGMIEDQTHWNPNDDFVYSSPKFDGGMVGVGNR